MPWKQSPPSISTVPSGFSARSFSIQAASTTELPMARPVRRSLGPGRIAPWKSVVSSTRSVGNRALETIPSTWARVRVSANAVPRGVRPVRMLTPASRPRRNDASSAAERRKSFPARAAASHQSSAVPSPAIANGWIHSRLAWAPSTRCLSKPSSHGSSESGTSANAPESRFSRQPQTRASQ